jgi:hypothetical protein
VELLVESDGKVGRNWRGAHKSFSSRDIAGREQQVLFGRLRAGFRWTQDDKLD